MAGAQCSLGKGQPKIAVALIGDLSIMHRNLTGSGRRRGAANLHQSLFVMAVFFFKKRWRREGRERRRSRSPQKKTNKRKVESAAEPQVRH